ncbi:MAG TPA: type II toxin-antitoxin system VapC family toxin [Candidatus Binatia bacterium]
MRFWDSSAIVPLVCAEGSSRACRAWLRQDPVVLVWALAATEVISALARKRREGQLDQQRFAVAKQRLAKLEQAWNEVIRLEAVRSRARRLIEVHPLRAADALHLAAALVAVEERTASIEFVTFDERLARAAEKEGFSVLAG